MCLNMNERDLLKLEANIRNKMKDISNQRVSLKDSGIGSLMNMLKKADEALYEKILPEYKKMVAEKNIFKWPETLLLAAMSDKIDLHQHCLHSVQQRIARIQTEIRNLQADANQETKSSAGDKYETGRAMAQLEIERNQAQLIDAEKLRNSLLAIDPALAVKTAQLGALVKTSKNNFYIAISLGQILLHGKTYFVVSPDSPIAKSLHNKKAGDSFVWNANTDQVLQVE